MLFEKVRRFVTDQNLSPDLIDACGKFARIYGAKYKTILMHTLRFSKRVNTITFGN